MSTGLKRWKPYPAYKDSGVVWLGQVPEGWEIKPLALSARLQGGFAFSSKNFVDTGVPVVRMNNLKRGHVDISDAVFVDAADCVPSVALKYGDILYGMSGSIGDTGSLGNFAVVKEADLPAQLNQRVGRFKIDATKMAAGFLVYFIQTPFFYRQILLYTTGTAQFNVSSKQIESCLIPFPPLPEQNAIAAFLDQQCALIDSLIEKKQRMLGLLDEKRRAVITQAVTRGLDPTVPMKDSSAEWLGMVPKGWEMKKFKHCATIASGQIDPKEYSYGDAILIAPDHIERNTGKVIEKISAHDQGAISGKYQAKRGQVIYSKIRPALNKACISEGDWLCSADMYPIAPHDDLHSKFLLYYIISRAFTEYSTLISMRVAMPKVNREQLNVIPVPLPPLPEQQAIADYLDAQCATMDSQRKNLGKSIELLREYRASLITHAVTGKIDVREVAPLQ